MPAASKFLDVLPALGMARTGDVGMGQLVHQDQGRAPRQGGVEVELLQHLAAIGNLARRQAFEPAEQGLGFLAAMRLDHADDHVRALRLLPSPAVPSMA
jgi:hypothetical protein